MVILSGPEQGSYYELVNDINRVLKKGENDPFINMSTPGAAYNFEQIANPSSEYKVALMQLDYLFFMQGKDAQNNLKMTNNIKVLVPLSIEEIHFVTKKSSGLTKLSDINSSTLVGIGDKSQGTYATANYINSRSEINWSSRNFPFDVVLKELMLGRIDVFVLVGSAPVSKLDISPIALKEPISLIEIDDFSGSDSYIKHVINADSYKWLDKDVSTFGVRTVMIVNESKLTDEDREVLKKMVDDLKTNMNKLIEQGHPKWKDVSLDIWDNKDWPSIKL